MVKHIISIAAAGAVLTTGAMAFDSDNGRLATDASGKIVYSSYNASEAPTMLNLTASTSLKGDALIYPYFTTQAGYSSEVVVRNTSANAIVAKVVFYSGDDSKELRDFNIYLSGYDVFRFTVEKDEDGEGSTIHSTDGSVITQTVLERNTLATDATATDYTYLKFASGNNEFTAPLGENRGYIAIFGMAQSDAYASNANTNEPSLAFHNRHADLYAGYAALLDEERGTSWRYWRNSDDKLNPEYMIGSLFVDKANVKAPNRDLNTTGTTVQWKESTADDREATFRGVDAVLTGQINVKNGTNGNDLLLPATALENFSDGNKTLLWTPGEYASIADRCIVDVDGNATYNKECVTNDSNVFKVSNAVYTYANHGSLDNADNKIFITQPYKRTLLQLSDDSSDLATVEGYTYRPTKTSTKLETGIRSFFSSKAAVYDENEATTPNQITSTENTAVGAALSGNGIGSSPQTVEPTGYNRELEMLNASAFELHDDVKDDYGTGNGFATFNVGVSAIITQMVASKVGDHLETNWVYSDTTK